MLFPFKTHRIYITLDDEKMYQLHADFSKFEVNPEEIITEEALSNSRNQPFVVIHKEQFDHGKSILMNKKNPNRISKETAEIYCRIGFLTKEEVQNYIQDKV